MQNIIKFLPSQLSTQPKILELLPDNAVHIYRHEKSGELPKRVSIGNHPVAWVEEIYQWVEDKISTGPLLSNEKNSDGE
jgi:predicted DNA-binding transcriptional regulator AlpA